MKNSRQDFPTVLFEDNHLLVISKPAGLLSQSDSSGAPSLVDWARIHVGRHYVGLIHRLDRNVSGVMLLAKRTKAARRLTEALRAGKIFRLYRGWVWGQLESPAVWRHFLNKNEKHNRVAVSERETPGSQEAILSARPIKTATVSGLSATLVEFNLETGRSHQIRAQCAHEGLPLIGDLKYGPTYAGQTGQISRPLLHSYRLMFEHPMTHEKMEFVDPLPDELDL